MARIKPPTPTVIIVGAGVGGVATAARLAKAGLDVTVVEKNDFTGGRCSLIREGGYRFDQGPSLLLLPHLFHATFADLDTTMRDEGIDIVKCEPNYRLWFHDGVGFVMSTCLAVMKSEIARVEGSGGFERYLSFLQEAHAHYHLSLDHVLSKNFCSIFSMLRPSFLRHVFALHPFESIWSRVGMYFKTERLRRAFTFASMYMGMSPFDAPGTYSLLQYTELVEGIWYPLGGFHRVVEGLVKIGERLGVTYRLNTPISRILLSEDGKRATGVVLPSGESLTADIVICNADLIYAYNNLLPVTPYAQSLTKREASCSSISFYWALDRKFEELSAHNIFLAEDYKESFDSIFKKHIIPDQPSFYVNVPSRIDKSAAPEGCDALVVLVPVGHLLDSASAVHKGTSSSEETQKPQDWPAMLSTARSTIISTIQSRLKISLAPHIVHETLNTPLSWKETFNLDRGAILGLSHSFFNVLCFRPKTKHSAIEGLYFVGASTHPGTGVPIVLAGAKVVSEQVLGHAKIRVPWANEDGEEVGKAGRESKIDRVEERNGSWIYYVVILFFALLVWSVNLRGEAGGWDWGKLGGGYVGDW